MIDKIKEDNRLMQINSLKRDLCMMDKKERETTDRKTSTEEEKT
jgi:hypothetical protein